MFLFLDPFATIISVVILSFGLTTYFQCFYVDFSEIQRFQGRGYDDVMSIYSTPEDACRISVGEEKSQYVAAVVKKLLRH